MALWVRLVFRSASASFRFRFSAVFTRGSGGGEPTECHVRELGDGLSAG